MTVEPVPLSLDVPAAAPAAPPAAASIQPLGQPLVPAFVLPTEDLHAVAQTAGLQWVNSDVDKIRAVQEAMAQEPKPTHAPREIKPAATIDEGPLVLVETRKDLSLFKLPFETAQGSQAGAQAGSQPGA